MGIKKKYPEPFRREGSKIYYFTATEDGKRRNVSTGETTKERAREQIREYMDRARSTTSAATFREYSSSFFIWEEKKAPSCPHAARLVAEGKVIGRQHCLAQRRLLERWILTDPVFPELRMNEIRRAHVVDLRARLLARSGKPNTTGKAVEALKVVLSEAEFREEIDANPGARVTKPKAEPRKRGAFTTEEVKQLLEERPGRMGSDARIGAAFYCLFLLGIRCGELRALRWRHLDLEARRGSIEEAVKGEKGEETGKPKWEKTRAVALPKLLVAELKDWKKLTPKKGTDDLVFADEEGAALTQQILKDAFASMLEAASTAEKEEDPLLEPAGRWLTPHSARHSLNSALLSAGASPLAVAEFMGWSSELGRALSRVQAGYTHLELVDLMKIADTIDGLFTIKKENEHGAKLA